MGSCRQKEYLATAYCLPPPSLDSKSSTTAKLPQDDKPLLFVQEKELETGNILREYEWNRGKLEEGMKKPGNGSNTECDLLNRKIFSLFRGYRLLASNCLQLRPRLSWVYISEQCISQMGELSHLVTLLANLAWISSTDVIQPDSYVRQTINHSTLYDNTFIGMKKNQLVTVHWITRRTNSPENIFWSLLTALRIAKMIGNTK